MVKKKPDITTKMRKLRDTMNKARHDADAVQSLCLTLDVFLAKAKKDFAVKMKRYEKAYALWHAEVLKEAKKQGVK